MPLGFGKSVLGQPTIAAASSSLGAYRQKNALSTGNLAAHTIEGIDWTADNDVSVVFWFRALNADADGDSDDWIDGTSGGASGTRFILVPHSGGNGFFRVAFTLQDHGFLMHMNSSDTDGANAYVDSRGQGRSNDGGSASSVASASFDGSWKCLMMSFQSDHNTGGNIGGTSASTAYQFRNCYVGDSDLTSSPDGHTAGPQLLNSSTTGDYDDGMIGYGNEGPYSTSVPTGSNGGRAGPGFHWGPMWVYNTFLDFDTQSIRRRFFNPSNTDGLVTPSNTGTTSAGATQPLLYLYWNGSALVNGGSDSVTLTKRTVGTGGDVVDVSDGPGSGGTI